MGSTAVQGGRGGLSERNEGEGKEQRLLGFLLDRRQWVDSNFTVSQLV